MSDQSGAGATPSPSDSESGTGATPIPTQAGTVVIPAQPPSAGAMPSEAPSPSDGGRRDADSDPQRDGDDARDAHMSPSDLQAALKASRTEARAAERERKRLAAELKQRTDAEKTDQERLTERAETAEARVAQLERSESARAVAAEFGIPQWVDELANDADVRAMKAHAQRIRERVNPGSPGMEGGVRSLGAPMQPASMDDLIRGRATR